MVSVYRDPALDTLLDLDGQILVVDPAGGHLTLHDARGERLAGFDNAHPVGRQKRGEPQDHRHRLKTVRPYDYRDAASLLEDFWTMVDTVLREKGVRS
jgi:hypothetical protein